MSDLSSQEPDLRRGQLRKKRRRTKIKPSCDIFVADIFKPAWYISCKGGNGGNIEKRNIQYVTQHLIITSAFYANNVCVKRIEK